MLIGHASSWIPKTVEAWEKGKKVSLGVLAELKNDWQGTERSSTKTLFFLISLCPAPSPRVPSFFRPSPLRVATTVLDGRNTWAHPTGKKPAMKATWNRVRNSYLFSSFIVREGPRATATWCYTQDSKEESGTNSITRSVTYLCVTSEISDNLTRNINNYQII